MRAVSFAAASIPDEAVASANVKVAPREMLAGISTITTDSSFTKEQRTELCCSRYLMSDDER